MNYFLDAVFQLKQAELGKRNEQQSRRIPLELQMLFANMLLVDKSAVSTTDLTDSFGWQNREVIVFLGSKIYSIILLNTLFMLHSLINIPIDSLCMS